MRNLIVCTLLISQLNFPLTLLANPFPSHLPSWDDSNIVIKNKTEHYEFVLARGTNESPVQVKEQSKTTYYCNSFRTAIPVVEFYDDKSTIDEVKIYVDGSKAKDIKPKYEYYSVENIFYSDAHVCYFQLPLEKKGTESEVQIEKTINDPRYFTTIFFSEALKVENKQVTIVVPRWMHLELKEMNFATFKIQKQLVYDSRQDADIYTYTIRQLPARRNEAQSPGPSYIYPHLMVLSKYADGKDGRITYFNKLDDQYAWYKSLVAQIGNDATVIKGRALEITRGINGDMEKVKAIYNWVQDNIRYLAFEDGIAGFKPESAQDVLKKKYGDCKGMANLTKELLVTSGFDARLCWIGTNHIAYDYSTPCLAVDNHMICAVKLKDQFYFLDATETYIGFNQYAERIQGRQVLIENGNTYLLEKIPGRPYTQNTEYEKRILKIEGTSLVGKIEQKWQGESKEWLLEGIHSVKKDKLPDALTNYLSENNTRYIINNLTYSDLNNRNNDLTIQYDLQYKDALSDFGNDLYLEMDFRKEMEEYEIKTEDRQQDWVFGYKHHLIHETELTIPTGYKIAETPPALKVDQQDYSFSINYKIAGDKLLYKKELIIKNTRLPKAAFEKWNKDIQQLKKFYSEQITFTKK